MTVVRELIASEVESVNGSLDPGEIAERIVAGLSPEELREQAVWALRREVAQFVAALRPPTQPPSSAKGSARWEQVKDARDLLDDWWVSFQDPQRAGKRLLDCSPADLLDAAEWYEKRAAGYQARADAYSKLANTLRRRKVATPADLPREEVRRILNA